MGSLHVQWGHASGWGSWSGVQLRLSSMLVEAPLEVGCAPLADTGAARRLGPAWVRWHPGARGEGACGLAGPLLFWSWTWKDQGRAALQALSHCSGDTRGSPWASCPSDTCGDPERSLCLPRTLKGTGLRPSVLPSVRSPGPTSSALTEAVLFLSCLVISALFQACWFQHSVTSLLDAPLPGASQYTQLSLWTGHPSQSCVSSDHIRTCC